VTARAIRLVAFDLDDTVWPTASVIMRAVKQWYAFLQDVAPAVTEKFSQAELGALMKAAPPEMSHDLTASRKYATRVACEESGVNPEGVVEPAFAEFAAWRSQVDDLIFCDVLPCLAQLQAKHPSVQLCAVTNGNSDISKTVLQPAGLSFSVRSEDVGKKKPDPAPYLKACELAGCGPDEVLFVGDNPVDDIAGAQHLGMRTVWINRKGVSWAEQATNVPAGVVPDEELPTLEKLPELISKWNIEAPRL